MGRQQCEDVGYRIPEVREMASELERRDPVDEAPDLGSDALGVVATKAFGTDCSVGVIDQWAVGLVESSAAVTRGLRLGRATCRSLDLDLAD